MKTTHDKLPWLIMAALAFLMLRSKQTTAAPQPLMVNGRVLLEPGLWRTEDWSRWEQIGPAV